MSFGPVTRSPFEKQQETPKNSKDQNPVEGRAFDATCPCGIKFVSPP
jgi:hypothetical protein